MQTYQVITKEGLTRNIEADSVMRSEHAVEFLVNGGAVILFRADMVLRVETCGENGPDEHGSKMG